MRPGFLESQRQATEAAVHLAKFRDRQRDDFVSQGAQCGSQSRITVGDQDMRVDAHAIRRIRFLGLDAHEFVAAEFLDPREFGRKQ